MFNYGNVLHPAMCYELEGKNEWFGVSYIIFPSSWRIFRGDMQLSEMIHCPRIQHKCHREMLHAPYEARMNQHLTSSCLSHVECLLEYRETTFKSHAVAWPINMEVKYLVCTCGPHQKRMWTSVFVAFCCLVPHQTAIGLHTVSFWLSLPEVAESALNQTTMYLAFSSLIWKDLAVSLSANIWRKTAVMSEHELKLKWLLTVTVRHSRHTTTANSMLDWTPAWLLLLAHNRALCECGLTRSVRKPAVDARRPLRKAPVYGHARWESPHWTRSGRRRRSRRHVDISSDRVLRHQAAQQFLLNCLHVHRHETALLAPCWIL